ncbi:MAG: putative amidophosphoribosyltransferase [Parcubacteria group bacterium Gr01-1014_24]|nr:MAG: putative amidophosphoribosyltransferase [Parcubacteria group bacterium Gr01-1014_24]
MRFLNTILDMVFPVNCISCGKPGVNLCLICLLDSPLAERENARWIFPLYDYRHPPIKKALWLFKYKGKKRLASIFAEILYGKIMEELSELSLMENFREPILIPIPLSAKRYRERGYNQAELICKELIKLDNNVNFKLENNILIKPRDTKHQAHIENRSERLKNIIGSFTVKNESINLIKGRNIILIDDITTTGATLTEARKTLKQAGARKIIAFTVAH